MKHNTQTTIDSTITAHLKIIHGSSLLIPKHIIPQLLLPLLRTRSSLLPRLGILSQLGLAVGKVTSLPEGTISAQKVLAQTDLVEFVGLRRRPSDRHAVFARLHLAQPQGEIGHHGQIGPLSSDVLVPAKGTVDAKSLTVKHALQSIRLGNVSKRTILDLAPIAVSTEGHFGEVVLVQEFARRALHAEVAEPVAADHGAEAGVVLGGG